MKDYRTPLLAILGLAVPVALHAQPGGPGRPRPGMAPGITASALLDARRMLELSPRQVARLDSLERVQLRRRADMRRQVVALRDSVCPRQQRCDLSEDQRRTLRDRIRGMRDVRADSLARVAALNVLDSTQRGRVQGWRMREAREAMAYGAGRGFGGPRGRQWRGQGMRGPGPFGAQGFGPRGVGPRGFGPSGMRMGPGRQRLPDPQERRRRPERDGEGPAPGDSLTP